MIDRVGFDGMVVSYLVQANSAGYNPSEDAERKLRPERVVAFKLMLYLPCTYLVPTVSEEIGNIPDQNLRKQHTNTLDILFHEVRGLESNAVNGRARTFYAFHACEKDCRIVAEAELASLDVLLSFDDDLIKHLGSHTDGLRLSTPSAYWQELDKSEGPRWTLHDTHPLSNTDWQHW